MLVDGDLSRLPDQQRVAIRRSGCHRMRTDRAAGAGAIFDHDCLAKRGAEFVRYRAGDDVAGASGSVGDNELNGAVWVSLAPTRRHISHGKKGCNKRDSRRPIGPHDRSSLVSSSRRRRVGSGDRVIRSGDYDKEKAQRYPVALAGRTVFMNG